MKILLLGDFSGVHLSLKKGLQELGSEVLLVSKGDGFKKFPADKLLYTRSRNENFLKGAVKEILDQILSLKHLKGYDVIQTASHSFFHNRMNDSFFPYVINRNKKFVLLNTACSLPYKEFYNKLSYAPCHNCIKFDLKNTPCEHTKDKSIAQEFKVYNRADAIVSTHFEYFQSFNNTEFKNKNKLILLPVDLSEHIFHPLRKAEKINIYYGELRKGFKGGIYIDQALEKLRKSSYSKYFNIICTSKMPYKEYIKTLNDTHVLIDQSSSYSYGMNALFALAKGKIVFSGAEPEALRETGIASEFCPIVNILPDSNDIFNKLVQLVEKTDNFEEWSIKNRKFVELNHDHLKIAKQYLNLYQTL